MRTAPLASLSFVLAVIAAVVVTRVPEDAAVAMVVAPVVLAVVIGLLLFAKSGGWRASKGLKDWLLFGPVQAQPDTLVSRVARGPAILLSVLLSTALGALAGMIIGGAA